MNLEGKGRSRFFHFHLSVKAIQQSRGLCRELIRPVAAACSLDRNSFSYGPAPFFPCILLFTGPRANDEGLHRVKKSLYFFRNKAKVSSDIQLRYSTLIYATLCHATLRYSTLRYSTLLYATLCFSTLLQRRETLDLPYLTLLCDNLKNRMFLQNFFS
jgi:hypothetical protein